MLYYKRLIGQVKPTKRRALKRMILADERWNPKQEITFSLSNLSIFNNKHVHMKGNIIFLVIKTCSKSQVWVYLRS